MSKKLFYGLNFKVGKGMLRKAIPNQTRFSKLLLKLGVWEITFFDTFPYYTVLLQLVATNLRYFVVSPFPVYLVVNTRLNNHQFNFFYNKNFMLWTGLSNIDANLTQIF